jgi:hypothetical protein
VGVDATTKPKGASGDFAVWHGAWDYDDTFDLQPGLRRSTPGHTPGHQAPLVSFDDGRNFVCAGGGAHLKPFEHRPTGRPSSRQPRRACTR